MRGEKIFMGGYLIRLLIMPIVPASSKKDRKLVSINGKVGEHILLPQTTNDSGRNEIVVLINSWDSPNGNHHSVCVT